MVILTKLSPLLEQTAHSSLATKHQIFSSATWDRLISLTEKRPVDLLILEPDQEIENYQSPLGDLFRKFADIPIILYIDNTNDAINQATRLPTHSKHDIVLANLSDSVVRLVTKVQHLERDYTLDIIFKSLCIAEKSVIRNLHSTLVDVFRHPHNFISVDDVARHSGISRRTVDREISKNNMPSARHLIVAARMLKTYEYTVKSCISLDQTANLLGYPDARPINRQANEFIGLRPKLWKSIPQDTFIKLLLSRLRTPDSYFTNTSIRV